MLFNKSSENFSRRTGNPIQQVLYRAGASFDKSNMTTWNDRTTSYSTLPRDQLDLAIQIEADRMRRGLILDEERQPEMTVVRNEYERGENNPEAALEKAVTSVSIWAHPYHWDTIGWKSDIEGVSTEKLREHYDTFYYPDNATAILVGDFDREEALSLFVKHFGAFPRAPKQIPAIHTWEPPQEGERRVTVKRVGNVKGVGVAYHRPGSLHPDFIPLDVLQAILGFGVSSRLYQNLVETSLANDARASNYTFRDPYLFYLFAVPGDTVPHAAVEEALFRVVEEVKEKGVGADEVRRAQGQIEVSVVSARDGTYPLASSLGEAVASADWEWWLDYLDRVKAVTAEDVRRVARRYLNRDQATVGWFVPLSSPSEATADSVVVGPDAMPGGPAGSPGRGGAGDAETPATGGVSGGTGGRGGNETGPVPTDIAPAGGGPEGEAKTFAGRTRRLRLANGAVLDLFENHAAPTVALQVSLRAGRFLDPVGSPGVSDLTAEMLTRGTTKRAKREIAASLEEKGARLDFAGGDFDITGTGYALSRDLDFLLELLAEELRTPSFPDDEIAKAKEELGYRIRQADESTFDRALRALGRRALPTTHPLHPPETSRRLQALAGFRRETVARFHRERFGPATLVIALAGDFDAEKTEARLRDLFAGWTGPAAPAMKFPRASLVRAGRENVVMKGKASVDVFLGNAGLLLRSDADYFPSLLANAVLGQSGLSSRLGRRVRDTEGLTYSIVSRFWNATLADGVWGISVSVAPGNVEKAVASSLDEFRKFVREGATEEELKAEKSAFAGRFQVALSDNPGVAAALVQSEIVGMGPRYLDEYPSLVRKVTLAEVRAAIRKHFDPSRIVVVAAGDVEG
jgi:zinc protease